MNIAAISEAAYSGGFRDVKSNAIASAIAMGESGGKSDAEGDGGESWGLWQIHLPAHPTVSKECAINPSCAAKAAYKISAGGKTWQPWTVYRIGAHLRYMREATNQAKVTVANKGKNPNSKSNGDGGFPWIDLPNVNDSLLDIIGVGGPNLPNPLDAIKDIAHFFDLISQKNTWIRIGYFFGGLIAVYIAVKILMAEEGIKGPKVGEKVKEAATVVATRGMAK